LIIDEGEVARKSFLALCNEVILSNMATLTIHDLSDQAMARLREQAERNQTTVEAEAARVLEDQTPADVPRMDAALLDRIDKRREGMPLVWESAEELQAVINQGRP
jgi:plasmid stability protein